MCAVALQPQTTPKPQRVLTNSVANDVKTLRPTPLPQKNSPQTPPKPNVLTRMLQSLGEELSVRWLLFLGMFLVVVSSGVLAASQWDKFPPSGQYGILLAYTLSFWGVSFWAGKQSNLNLTARSLLIVTLLLVPVNFWAIDNFQLWQNPLNWIVIAIASVILTSLTVFSCKTQLFATNNHVRNSILFNILGLSYLHWGWQLPGFPLIAVYLATVGTAIATVYRIRFQQPISPTSSEGDKPPLPREVKVNRAVLPLIIIIYALVVLLVRAIFIVQVDIQQLGLAIGICGALLTWLATDDITKVTDKLSVKSTNQPLPTSPSRLWEILGGVLLFLGWLVSVGTTFPWQASIVSLLGLWFFNRRLQRNGVRADVGAIFVIGLETIWLGWRLLPANIQQWIVTVATQLTYSHNAPWELLSVGLFPYVLVMLALANKLYRADKVPLAVFAERLTLMFGILLTLLSVENPSLRSINLLLSTVTLWSVSQRRSLTKSPLVYMTQIALVLTICSVVDRLLPSLSQEVWASLLLVMAIAQLLFSVGSGIWRRSAWHMGLALAVLSYTLLWGNANLAWVGAANGNENWGLIWLAIPMTLTGLGSWGYKTQTTAVPRSSLNIWLSVAASGLSLSFTLPLTGGRLIGLIVATALMFVNTYYLRQKSCAVVTVGFGLGAFAALLWEGIPGLPRLSGQGWFLVGAVAITCFWLMRSWLEDKQTRAQGNTGNEEVSASSSTLLQIYAIAFDRWAIALCSAELLCLSGHSLLVYQNLINPGFLSLISCAIALGAIAYRSWQQPTNWGFYGIGWCLELLIAELLGFSNHSLIQIAIANIALGLMAQLLGEWWQRRHRLEQLPNRWHILPLMYGIFGVMLRWQTFSNWTGLSTLAVALIAIGVGRRRQECKPLVYIGLVGVSVSAYELLLYQLLQLPGGAYGDGLIAMSVLGTGIMYVYRILSPWLLGYLRLSSKELKVVAHIHWALSSGLLIAASFSPVEAKMLGLGTGLFLIRYAIFQGRIQQENTSRKEIDSSAWVYLGLLQMPFLRVYLPEVPIVGLLEKQLLPWQGAIASVIAYFVYIMPWETWGWSKKPWQKAAYILPLLFLWQTRVEVYSISLLIAAAFYTLVAKTARKFRFTYLSLALVNWALFRWLFVFNFTDALWYVTLIGLSLLYIAQFDPELKLPKMKGSRHSLRLLGSSIICGWAILFHQDAALLPGIFSLIAIFAGLALRVRAFLYIGVAAFFITSFYQLVLFSLQYPFFKWVVGLLVGILLLTIAANFENRREQLNSLLRNASEQLQEWE
ncbi:hypothetical protein NUACC21_41780 [Scytonema sp. NUACC21]